MHFVGPWLRSVENWLDSLHFPDREGSLRLVASLLVVTFVVKIQWIRRESNPRPESHRSEHHVRLRTFRAITAAHWLRLPCCGSCLPGSDLVSLTAPPPLCMNSSLYRFPLHLNPQSVTEIGLFGCLVLDEGDPATKPCWTFDHAAAAKLGAIAFREGKGITFVTGAISFAFQRAGLKGANRPTPARVLIFKDPVETLSNPG